MLPEGKNFRINDKEFSFSVAVSAMELIQGLKGVTSLEPYNGMLFDFGADSRPIMTPKGLEFPVDLAFIDRGGKIVDIKRLDPALGFTQSTSSFHIRYTLEVPVGFFDENNIKLGDTIII